MTSNDDTVQDTSRYLMEALAHLEVAAEIIKAHASGKAHQHWLKLFAYLLDVADVEAIKPDLESPLHLRLEGLSRDMKCMLVTLAALFDVTEIRQDDPNGREETDRVRRYLKLETNVD